MADEPSDYYCQAVWKYRRTHRIIFNHRDQRDECLYCHLSPAQIMDESNGRNERA